FGFGRGGTSALAGVLRILGVAMPKTVHPLKHEWSPVVYASAGIDRDNTRRRIEEMNREHPIWGWKSPRDVFGVSQFETMLRNPHYIVIFRNIFDVCASTKRYEGLSFEALMPDVAASFSEIAHFIGTSMSPLALASFEQLTADPESTIGPIAGWLGLAPGDETVRCAAQFVSEK